MLGITDHSTLSLHSLHSLDILKPFIFQAFFFLITFDLGVPLFEKPCMNECKLKRKKMRDQQKPNTWLAERPVTIKLNTNRSAPFSLLAMYIRRFERGHKNGNNPYHTKRFTQSVIGSIEIDCGRDRANIEPFTRVNARV